jgi:hypothetical protein
MPEFLVRFLLLVRGGTLGFFLQLVKAAGPARTACADARIVLRAHDRGNASRRRIARSDSGRIARSDSGATGNFFTFIEHHSSS